MSRAIFAEKGSRIARKKVAAPGRASNGLDSHKPANFIDRDEDRRDETQQRQWSLAGTNFGPMPSQEGAADVEAASFRGPLDAVQRSVMEPIFKHDFRNVRIHSGPEAARSAQTFGAAAYTLDRDIFFGRGRYMPGTQAGKVLLAHELAHIVQLENGLSARRSTSSSIGELENEAASVSSAVERGQTPVPVRGVARQRGPLLAGLPPESATVEDVPTFGNLPQSKPKPGGKLRVVELREIDGVWYEISGSRRFRARGSWAFVVKNNRIWGIKGGQGGWGHTEAAQGERVAYAGEVQFGGPTGRAGIVTEWSNASGHYAPVRAFFESAVKAGLPKNRFVGFVVKGAEKGPQLPVFQPRPDEVLSPSNLESTPEPPKGADPTPATAVGGEKVSASANESAQIGKQETPVTRTPRLLPQTPKVESAKRPSAPAHDPAHASARPPAEPLHPPATPPKAPSSPEAGGSPPDIGVRKIQEKVPEVHELEKVPEAHELHPRSLKEEAVRVEPGQLDPHHGAAEGGALALNAGIYQAGVAAAEANQQAALGPLLPEIQKKRSDGLWVAVWAINFVAAKEDPLATASGFHESIDIPIFDSLVLSEGTTEKQAIHHPPRVAIAGHGENRKLQMRPIKTYPPLPKSTVAPQKEEPVKRKSVDIYSFDDFIQHTMASTGWGPITIYEALKNAKGLGIVFIDTPSEELKIPANLWTGLVAVFEEVNRENLAKRHTEVETEIKAMQSRLDAALVKKIKGARPESLWEARAHSSSVPDAIKQKRFRDASKSLKAARQSLNNLGMVLSYAETGREPE